jgi:hypothetical protein
MGGKGGRFLDSGADTHPSQNTPRRDIQGRSNTKPECRMAAQKPLSKQAPQRYELLCMYAKEVGWAYVFVEMPANDG